jgi:hypothetical protein
MRWPGRWPQEFFTPENAYQYGKFLGTRYKNEWNIVWILGGDRDPEEEQDYEIVRSLAKGIRDAGAKQLMSYHPMGNSNSSQFFHADEWLGFNMFQSGHHATHSFNFEFNQKNRSLLPVKPTIDGEPKYEDIPVNFNTSAGQYFDEKDVREAAFWSVLSGACGHTFGNNNVWQFYGNNEKPKIGARRNWKAALDMPGAFQMGYLKILFEKYKWHKMVPCTGIIANYNPQGPEYIVASVSDERKFAFIYSPYGKTIMANLNYLNGASILDKWFNPRDGEIQIIGQTFDKGIGTYTPPVTGPDTDWLLILEVLN